MKNKITRIFALMMATVLSLSIICVCPTGSVAASDVPAGAIPISTVDELAMIGYEYPANGYYYLVDNIDATKATSKGGDYYNEGLGFEPIGNSDTPFTGTFDGQGYSIIGLNINRPEQDNVGLFGYTKGATIKNTIVKGASIAGMCDVAAFVGEAQNTVINNCVNHNQVNSIQDSGSGTVGGIVGYSINGITIENCVNFGSITTSGRIIGGIAGHVGVHEIVGCKNFGELKAVGSHRSGGNQLRIGGIAAQADTGVISNCLNYGHINGDFISSGAGWGSGTAGWHGNPAYNYISGIAAIADKVELCANNGDIIILLKYEEASIYSAGISGEANSVVKCYNAGSIQPKGRVSGSLIGSRNSLVCGRNSNVVISDCFNISKDNLDLASNKTVIISNCYTLGGRIGYGTATNCYYDAETTSGNGERRTTRQLRIQSTFADWDFENVWTMGGNEDYLYPELQGLEMDYKKSLTKISVNTEPDKLTYLEHKETLDLTGAQIKLHYDNDTTENIPMTADMISGFDNTKVGAQTLKVTYGGFETSFDVTILAKTLSSISIKTLPTKRTYLEGKDTLDVTGGVITLLYNNDTTAEMDITPSMISGFDNSKVGKQNLTVTHGGRSTTYPVEIIAKELIDIEISTLPFQTDYLEGKDTLDLTGGKLKLYFDNDTTAEIDLSEAIVTGFDNNRVGTQLLNVYYDGFSTSLRVTVTAKSVSRVVLSAMPATLVYLEGKDNLDLSGGKLRVTYNNGTQDEIDMTAEMVSGFDNEKVGRQTLTVNYGGKTTVFEVEVIAKTLVSVTVKDKPAKLTYRENKDKLDVTGGTLFLEYNNGKSETVDMTASMVSGFDNSVVGKCTVLVTYKGKTDTFDVEIIPKVLVSIGISKLPAKTSYLEARDTLDLAGGELTLYYDNDSTEKVAMALAEISGFDNTRVGKQTLTVTYQGKSTTFDVMIQEKSLSSVSIKTVPTVLNFLESKDNLSVDGGVLTLAYNNGTVAEIAMSVDMVSGFDNTKVGKQTLTVTFGGKTATYDISIMAKKLTELKLTQKPSKLVYEEGEKLNLNGLVVTAIYNNDTSAVVTDYEVSGFESTIGEKTVYIAYGEFSVSFTVNVIDGECKGDDKCPGKHFTDVGAPDSWMHEGIDYAVKNGLFNGTGKNTFSPNANMTRAMLVTVLYRMEGSPSVAGIANSFNDVKAGQYYYDAVLWASSNGVVNGVGAGKFAPNNNVTREQMATILYRYSEKKGIDVSDKADISAFPDSGKVSSYAEDAIAWANGAGLIGGTNKGGKVVIDPLGNATRAQVATILMRYKKQF